MSEWRVPNGRDEFDPVALARRNEVLECELDGHAFVFACEVVPNQWAGRGVAVMMQLAERAEAPPSEVSAGSSQATLPTDPVRVRDLAVAFDEDELPQELDLATLVRCRTRAQWLFASAAELIQCSNS